MHRSLNHWISQTFGGREQMDDAMGWSRQTTNRWYRSNPRKFLMYSNELKAHVGAEELQKMVQQRLHEIDYGHANVVADKGE